MNGNELHPKTLIVIAMVLSTNSGSFPSNSHVSAVLGKSPLNCRRFHDNLYQIHSSGCSVLHESRRQSLPHPYRPLRAPTFFRISRNRVQANNPHLDKSFGMKLNQKNELLHLCAFRMHWER